MIDAPPRWYAPRPDLVAVRFRGKDVFPFLQSKLAANTRLWRRDGGGYAVATDINGKILFDGVFSVDGDDVIAAMPAAHADEAVAHLERYIIMEDVTIERPTDLKVWVGGGDTCPDFFGFELGDEPGFATKTEWEGMPMRMFKSPGPVPGAEHYLWVFPEYGDAVVGNALRRAEESVFDAQALEDAEVAAGWPRIGRDFMVGETLPLEAGLWNGVSLSKGCYLGQEVLERLFSRGNAARRLARFELEGEAASGDALICDGKDAGVITSAVHKDGRSVGMAMVRRRALADDAPAISVGEGGATLTLLGFVGGETPENP